MLVDPRLSHWFRHREPEQSADFLVAPQCRAALATCTTDLGTCTGELTTCTTDLGTCNDQLATAQKFPATGQTTCYTSGGAVTPCAGTGQDGDVQAGATLSYTDNGDGTITDNNTGLMWEKKSDDGSIHDKDTTYTWDNAFPCTSPD